MRDLITLFEKSQHIKIFFSFTRLFIIIIYSFRLRPNTRMLGLKASEHKLFNHLKRKEEVCLVQKLNLKTRSDNADEVVR